MRLGSECFLSRLFSHHERVGQNIMYLIINSIKRNYHATFDISTHFTLQEVFFVLFYLGIPAHSFHNFRFIAHLRSVLKSHRGNKCHTNQNSSIFIINFLTTLKS